MEQESRTLGANEIREIYMTIAQQYIEKGRQKGKREGKREGKLEGKREGKIEAKQESLLQLLTQKFDAVPEADKRRMMETQDMDRLNQAIGRILKTETIEDILLPLD